VGYNSGDESIPLLAFCEHDETPAWLPPRGVTALLRSSPWRWSHQAD